jgi:hypothetical protein
LVGVVSSSVEGYGLQELVGECESSACEEKTRRLVLNGRQAGTQLVELSFDKSSAWAAVTRGPERGKLNNLLW